MKQKSHVLFLSAETEHERLTKELVRRGHTTVRVASPEAARRALEALPVELVVSHPRREEELAALRSWADRTLGDQGPAFVQVEKRGSLDPAVLDVVPRAHDGAQALRARRVGRPVLPSAKRVLDLLVVVPLVIALLPLWALLALAIKLDSRGPVFFVQERVGRRGRGFPMIKFRTMCVDAEARRGAVVAELGATQRRFKSRRDPRITRVGAFLRRASLDELPQLWNVLCGQMSLVGPRPPIRQETDAYTASEWRRLDCRPGLTCFWQTQGRSEIPFEGQVKLDLRYLRERSLWTDLRILCSTVPAVLSGRGAY